MGMFYLGPIDGHDVETLVKVLKNLNNGSRHGPILLHVVTEKGKGHPFQKFQMKNIMLFQNLML